MSRDTTEEMILDEICKLNDKPIELRDHFAGLYMQALSGSPDRFDWSLTDIAKESYQMADAMLKERESK